MFRRPAATQADDLAKVLSIIAGFQSLLWNTHVRNELLNEVGVLGHISDGANRMCGRIFKLDPGLCALGGNRDNSCLLQVAIAQHAGIKSITIGSDLYLSGIV